MRSPLSADLFIRSLSRSLFPGYSVTFEFEAASRARPPATWSARFWSGPLEIARGRAAISGRASVFSGDSARILSAVVKDLQFARPERPLFISVAAFN